MIKVVYWDVPVGALSRFHKDQWDHAPVFTLHHQTSKWVPAHVDPGEHIWLESGSELTVPMPPMVGGFSEESVERTYRGMMAQARETFAEIVGEITPKAYEGTLGVIHRGTMYGSFGLTVNFGLGFTQGNAFDEPPWFRPTEAWCPKEIHFGPEPPSPYRKTLWELLNEDSV